MHIPLLRKVLLLSLMLLLMLVVSGCWSRKEIDKATFIGAVAIDQADNDPKSVEVTVEFIIPKAFAQDGGTMGGGGAGQQVKYWLITTKGRSVDEAFTKLEPLVPYHLYFGHLTTIIIGEKAARQGIKNVIDTFDRKFILRRNMWLMISPGKARDILHSRSKLQDVPSIAISDLFSLQNMTTVSYPSNMNRFLISLSSRSTDPVLARVTTNFNKEGDQIQGQTVPKDSNTDIQLEGAAILKDDKLVDWMNGSETRGLLWVQNKVRRGLITFKNSRGNKKLLTFEIISGKTLIHTDMKNGKLIVSLKIYFDANLDEQNSNADVLTRGLEYEGENINGYVNGMSAQVKDEITSAFKKAQRYKADILGIGEHFYIEHPQDFKQVQNKWPEVFAQAEFKVSFDAHVRRIGLISRSINSQGRGK